VPLLPPNTLFTDPTVRVVSTCYDNWSELLFKYPDVTSHLSYLSRANIALYSGVDCLHLDTTRRAGRRLTPQAIAAAATAAQQQSTQASEAAREARRQQMETAADDEDAAGEGGVDKQAAKASAAAAARGEQEDDEEDEEKGDAAADDQAESPWLCWDEYNRYIPGIMSI